MQDPRYRQAAQEQADAERLVAQQQHTAARLAAAQAKQQARDQEDAANAALKATRSQQELDMRAQGMIPVTTADGNLHPDPLWEQKQAAKAAKEQKAAEAAKLSDQFAREGRKSFTSKVTGLPVALESDAQLAEAQKARASAARKAALNDRITGLETGASDPAKRPLADKARANVVKNVKKVIQEKALPALQASLQERAKAVSGGNDYIPFNESATPDAKAAQEHLARLQSLDPSNPDLTDEDLAALEANDTTKPFVQTIRNGRAILARDEENKSWHDQHAATVFDLKLRRDDPAAWAEMQRTKRAAMDPAALRADLEASGADLQARSQELNDAFAPIQQRRAQTQQKLTDLSQQAAQRRQQGLTAGEMVTMTQPDGTTETWPADLAAEYERHTAIDQEAEAQDAPTLERIIAQRDDLLAQEALHNEGAALHATKQTQARATQTQDAKNSLRFAIGGDQTAQELDTIEQSAQQRLTDLQATHGGHAPPEALAALDTDITQQKQTALVMHQQRTMAAHGLYSGLQQAFKALPEGEQTLSKHDQLRAIAAKNLAEAAQVDESTAMRLLTDAESNDWSKPLERHGEKATADTFVAQTLKELAGDDRQYRITSSGGLLINPIITDPAKYQAAVDASPASPEAKADAMRRLPDVRLKYGEDTLETIKTIKDTFGSDEGFAAFHARQPKGTALEESAARFADSKRAVGALDHIGKFTGMMLISGLQGTVDLGTQVMGLAAGITPVGGETIMEGAQSAQNLRNAMGAVKTLHGETPAALGGGSVSRTLLGGADMVGSLLPSLIPAAKGAQLARGGLQLFAGTKLGAKLIPSLAGGLESATTLAQAAKASQALTRAGMAGAGLAGAAQTYGSQLADIYGSLRQGNPELSHSDALAAAQQPAILSAAVTAALTTFVPGGTEKLFANPAAAKELFKKQFASQLQRAGYITGQAAVGAGKEWMEEIPDEVFSQYQSAVASDPTNPLAGVKALAAFLRQLPELSLAVGALGGAGELVQGYRSTSVSPPADPRAALPETNAAAYAEIEAFGKLEGVDPAEVPNMQNRANVALAVAQGLDLGELEPWQLATMDVVEDPKNPGKFINGKVVQSGEGSKVVTYANGQVPDASSPTGFREARIRIDTDGNPVISKTYRAALDTHLPAVARALNLQTQANALAPDQINSAPAGDTQTGPQQSQPGPAQSAPANPVSSANPSPVQTPPQQGPVTPPVGHTFTQPGTKVASTSPSPTVSESPPLEPAQQQRATELATLLEDRGLTAPQALAAAQHVVAKQGIVGASAEEQFTQGIDDIMSKDLSWVRGSGAKYAFIAPSLDAKPAEASADQKRSDKTEKAAGILHQNEESLDQEGNYAMPELSPNQRIQRNRYLNATNLLLKQGFSHKEAIAALDELGLSISGDTAASQPASSQETSNSPDTEDSSAVDPFEAEAAEARAKYLAEQSAAPPTLASALAKDGSYTPAEAKQLQAEYEAEFGASLPQSIADWIAASKSRKNLDPSTFATQQKHFLDWLAQRETAARGGKLAKGTTAPVSQSQTPPVSTAPASAPIPTPDRPETLRRNQAWIRARTQALAGTPKDQRPQARQILNELERGIAANHALFKGLALGVSAQHLLGRNQDMAVTDYNGRTVLALNLPGILNQFRNLTDIPAGVRASLLEEAIHAAALGLAKVDPKKYGYDALVDKWKRLPAALRLKVWKSYKGVDIQSGTANKLPTNLTEQEQWQMFHEFIRMLVQDKFFAKQVSEAAAQDKNLAQWLIDLLKDIGDTLRKLLNLAAPDLKADIEGMVDQIGSVMQSMQAASAENQARLVSLPSIVIPSARTQQALENGTLMAALGEHSPAFSHDTLGKLWDKLPVALQQLIYTRRPDQDSRKASKTAMMRELLTALAADPDFANEALSSLVTQPGTAPDATAPNVLTTLLKRMRDTFATKPEPDVVEQLKSLLQGTAPEVKQQLQLLHTQVLQSLSNLHDIKRGIIPAAPAAAPTPVPPSQSPVSQSSADDGDIPMSWPADKQLVQAPAQDDSPLEELFPDAALGKKITLTAPNGSKLNFRAAVVEALGGETIPSMDFQGRDRADFPSELQPRTTEKSALSQQKRQEIAQNTDYSRLSNPAGGIRDGAPKLTRSKHVVIGNHRDVAIDEAYARPDTYPNIRQYEQDLRADAANWGIDAAKLTGIKHPKLVFILEDTVDLPLLAQMGNAEMGAVDQAYQDAAAISGGLSLLTPSEEGKLPGQTNGNFFRWFLTNLVHDFDQKGRFFDDAGELTQDGMERVQRALLAFAYGDSPHARRLINQMVASPEEENRNLARVLSAIAPTLADIKSRIADGSLHDLDISPDIVWAAYQFSRSRKRGESIETAFERPLTQEEGWTPATPLQESLLRFFDANARSARQTLDTFIRYNSAVLISGDPRQTSLFGDEKPDAETLWKLASNYKQPALAMGSKTVRRDMIDWNTSPEDDHGTRVSKSYLGGNAWFTPDRRFFHNQEHHYMLPDGVDYTAAMKAGFIRLRPENTNGEKTLWAEFYPPLDAQTTATLKDQALTNGYDLELDPDRTQTLAKASTSPRLPVSPSPSLPPKTALKLYRTLTAKQAAGEPLNPGQSHALERAERSLGQLFLFDTPNQTLKPAENLVLERQTVKQAARPEEQLKLFMATKSPKVQRDAQIAATGGGRRLTGPEAFGQEHALRLGGKARARFLPAVWQMLQDTYRAIGHQYTDADELLQESTLWDVVLDPTTRQPIAFNIAKIGPTGYKAVAFGSDGVTGKLAVRGIIARLNEDGYWAELSDAPAHIARKTGIPILPASEASALLGKPVTVLEDGFSYERWITGLPTPHIKTIFGLPWKTPQTLIPSAPRSTNLNLDATPALTKLNAKNSEKLSSPSPSDGNSASPPPSNLAKGTTSPAPSPTLEEPGNTKHGPEDIRSYQRYWINKEGIAYPVSDHLEGAQRAKASSSDFDSRRAWGYEDMWQRGWARIATEPGEIFVDMGSDYRPNSRQMRWLNDARIYLEKKTGSDVRLTTGKGGNMLQKGRVSPLTSHLSQQPDLFSFNTGMGLDTLLTPRQKESKVQQSQTLDLFGGLTDAQSRPTPQRPARPARPSRPQQAPQEPGGFGELFAAPGMAGNGLGGRSPLGTQAGQSGSLGGSGNPATGGGETVATDGPPAGDTLESPDSGMPGMSGLSEPAPVLDRPSVGSPDRNFEVQDSVESLAPATDKAKILANVAAIKLLKELEADRRNATPEEKKTLASYTGWGAFKEAFNSKYEDDITNIWDGVPEYRRQYMPDWLKSWEKNHRPLHKLLRESMSEDEFSSASASTLNAHYTAAPIIRAMWKMVDRLGFKGGRALEPSAGAGHYLGLTPAALADKTQWQTVELDDLSARLLSKLYPEATVNESRGDDATRAVTGLGFERARIPNGSLDLVISNVPFHESGPRKKGFPNLNLHNFFFAHALDKVKPGGLVAFITSESTMQNNMKQRDFIASKGDLVAAFRLPNNAFKATAGTEVTTDIIILRKPDGTPFKGQPWRNLIETGRQTITLVQGKDQTVDELRREAERTGTIVGKEYFKGAKKAIDVSAPIMVNEYFVNHPQHVLGTHTLASTMYRAGGYAVVAPDGLDVTAALDALIPSLPANIVNPVNDVTTVNPLASRDDKPFSFKEQDGKLYEVQPDGSMEEAEWATNPEMVKTWRSWKRLSETVEQLVTAEASDSFTDEGLAQLRRSLNIVYDSHIAAHKPVSRRFSNAHRHLYSDPGYPLTSALENEVITVDSKTGKKTYSYKKADIFTKRIGRPIVIPKTAKNVDDALELSLAWKGHIDPAYASSLLGITPAQFTQQALTRPDIFENPNTSMLEQGEEYLAGNVRSKLETAEAAAQDNPRFQKNVDALRAAQPERKEIARISPVLGARWIPAEVYNAFIKDVLHGSDSVEYIPAGNSWIISGAGLYRTEEHGTERKGPASLFKHALDMTEPMVYDGSGENRTFNPVETAAAKTALDKMRRAFIDYVKTSDTKVTPVNPVNDVTSLPVWELTENAFNETQNSYVTPRHVGAYLKFPGLNTDYVYTKAHRRGVIARFLNTRRGMMAHGVGSGKTFNQIILAQEMRRLGLAKKPMIVVQNTTLVQFAKSYLKAYPSARILVPTKGDFEAQNRRKLVAKIATGNWDAIILPHSQFDLISNKSSAVKAYMDGQIDELMAIVTKTKDKAKVRDLEGMVKRLKDRRQDMLDKLAARQDTAVMWEDLGIDALIMDEAHNYKSLPIITRMGRVKGVPASSNSQRAINFMLKCRDVQSRTGGKNIFLATGTPIKNSMAEAYIMMQFMAPDVLEDFHIHNFDDFATSYGQTVTEAEMAWGGTPKMETRFAKFQNGSSLVTMIRTMFDVAFGNEKLGLDVPKIKGGEPEMVIVPATPAIQQFNAWTRNVNELWKNADPKEKEEYTAVPIQTMAAGIAAALDPRLLAPGVEDHPGSKVNEAVRRVAAIHKAGTARRSTQIIFSDLRNPFSLDYLLPFTGHPFPESSTTSTTPTESTTSPFDLYKDIQAKLIASGIPAAEIHLMQSGMSDVKKAALFEKVDAGEIRVIIGSTELLGVGVNIQTRLKAVHHLMPPRDFTPAMMEQRNGRIIRQGNLHAEKVEGQPAWNEDVEIVNYGTEGSMDSAIYGTLARKQRFITQLLMGEDVQDTFDDPTDPVAVNMAEMAARTLGDPDFIRRIELEKEIKDLRLQNDAFTNELAGKRSRLSRLDSQLSNGPAALAEAQDLVDRHANLWKRKAPRPEGVKEDTDISDKAVYEFGGQTIDTATKDGAITNKLDLQLLEVSTRAERRGQTKENFILTLNEYPVTVEVHQTIPGTPTGGYVLTKGGKNLFSFNGAASLIQNLRRLHADAQSSVDFLRDSFSTTEDQATKLRAKLETAGTFPEADRLAALELEARAVDERLRAKSSPPPSTTSTPSIESTLPDMQPVDPGLMTYDVEQVIDNADIEGNKLFLPDTLDRKLYQAVNAALESAGGVWSKRAKAHVFKGDPRPYLGLAPLPVSESTVSESSGTPSLAKGSTTPSTLTDEEVDADLSELAGLVKGRKNGYTTSYESATLDPYTGAPSLITGSRVTREQGQAIGHEHARRLRAGLREGREQSYTGPALASDRSRAFSVNTPERVPLLSTAQFAKLQRLPVIGEGAEAQVHADHKNGVVYKVLQGAGARPTAGIWPQVYFTSSGRLDYAFAPAERPRQLATRLAIQTLIGGTPTEVVGIGPDGHIILKQPLSPNPDLYDSMATAMRSAGLVEIPRGMLYDNHGPRLFLAFVEGRPWLIMDVKTDNFVGDNQGDSRINDPIVANLPASTIAKVPGLAAVVREAHSQAQSLGDRSNRLFMATKVPVSPMASASGAAQSNEPSPGGLSEAEVPKPKIQVSLLQELLQDIDSYGPLDPSDSYRSNVFNDWVRRLRNKGINFVDAYHITDAALSDFNEDGIKGSSVDYIGRNSGNLRDSSVYLFLDPDDIDLGYDGILGARNPVNNVLHVEIPLDQIGDLRWDSNFNITYGSYSGVRNVGDIPYSWIKGAYPFTSPAARAKRTPTVTDEGSLSKQVSSSFQSAPEGDKDVLTPSVTEVNPESSRAEGGTLAKASTTPSPLAKLGWNHLDRAASAKLAAHTRWLTTPTHALANRTAHNLAGNLVAMWTGSKDPQPFLTAAHALKRELLPDSVMPREVLAKKREMEIKTAMGSQRAMDLVRALSGNPKFSDLAYPKEFAENPMHRRNLYEAMTGERPMSSLPPELQTLATKLRGMLIDIGKEAVKQGRMSTDTFDNLRGSYMPHYYKEDVQKEKSLFHKFRLGVRDILAQRTTAWHITDTATKDANGEHRLVSHSGNQWRFRSPEHMNAFYEDFINQEALSLLKVSKSRVSKSLSAADLMTPSKLDAEVRGRLQEIKRSLHQRYQRNRPLTVAEQEKAGLIMDPVYAIARYAAQMAHDNSTAEWFNFVAADAKNISDIATPGFTEVPDNPRFGRLAGKFVQNDIAQQVLEMIEAPNIALQIYDTALGWWKAGKTVLNPGTHVRNVLGNIFFSQLAGNSVWNPGNTIYYRQALQAIRNGGPVLTDAYDAGVLGADFVSAELRQTLRQLLPDPATIVDDGKAPTLLMGMGKAIGKYIGSPAGKTFNKITALYQAEDEIFKLAAYLKTKSMLAEQGTENSELRTRAAAHVRQWFPYFDSGTSGTLKLIGRTAMPFLGFYRESIRIFGHALKERPLALAAGLSVPSIITFLSAMALGLDDDDLEEIKADMRGRAGKLLGPTPLGGMPLFSMLLPVRSDTGQVQQFDISAIHPFVDFLGNRVEGGQKDGWWPQMFRSFVSAGPLGNLIYSNMTGEDAFFGSTIVEPNMTTAEAAKARLSNAAKTLLPPLAPGGTGFNTLLTMGERSTGKTLEVRSPTQALVRTVGGLDVRNATPDLYRLADDWRKAHGYETTEGMDYGSTTPASRARKALFTVLAQDTPNPTAIKNLLGILDKMGHPVRTQQDVNRLLFYRDPAKLIGGNKAKGITATDAQAQFRASLHGEARAALERALQEYQRIKQKAPLLIRQAQ